VWIGGTGADLRSKARTLAKVPSKPEDLPHWNYDGSSTGQAPGTDSEVYLVPRAIFRWVPLCVYVGGGWGGVGRMGRGGVGGRGGMPLALTLEVYLGPAPSSGRPRGGGEVPTAVRVGVWLCEMGRGRGKATCNRVGQKFTTGGTQWEGVKTGLQQYITSLGCSISHPTPQTHVTPASIPRSYLGGGGGGAGGRPGGCCRKTARSMRRRL
jgi:hypothetical protein